MNYIVLYFLTCKSAKNSTTLQICYKKRIIHDLLFGILRIWRNSSNITNKTPFKGFKKGGIMPYKSDKALPMGVKGHTPKHAQDTYRKAFNNALKEYGQEDRAAKVAWAAVKKAGYKKSASGEWSKSAGAKKASSAKKTSATHKKKTTQPAPRLRRAGPKKTTTKKVAPKKHTAKRATAPKKHTTAKRTTAKRTTAKKHTAAKHTASAKRAATRR